MSTRRYVTTTANAPWIKCDVCKKPSAVAVRVECEGRSGRKGSRHLGYYCNDHVQARLDQLRKNAK